MTFESVNIEFDLLIGCDTNETFDDQKNNNCSI